MFPAKELIGQVPGKHQWVPLSPNTASKALARWNMRLSCAFLLLVLMDTGRGFRSLQHARGTLSRRRHASARAIANFEPQQMESLTDMPGAEYLADMPGASGDEVSVGRPLRVVVAGGGIGGLCAALVLKKQGFDVQVFEKAKEYKPFGGPIQIATNALESFRRIDVNVHARIMESATMIGDRKNGLKDGLSNEWFATFDLLTPAQDRGQEASVVIDRPTLQDILLSEVGDCVYTGVEVTGYEKQAADISAVVATLANGTRVEADLLVGSDGIWSKVRGQVRGKLEPPVWSGYTCFAAIANVVPDDIATVGYKVFLGSRKYFVSVDVRTPTRPRPPSLPLLPPLPVADALHSPAHRVCVLTGGRRAHPVVRLPQPPPQFGETRVI